MVSQSMRDKIILLCLNEGAFRSNELLGVHLKDIDFAEPRTMD